MWITRRELPVLLANLVYVPVFLVLALRRFNIEFVMYVGVILIVGGWVLWEQRRIRFGLPVLWGLTIWGFLHLAGGNLHIGGDVLYNRTLVPIIGAPYHVIRYDQIVHTFGFGVATLVCHHLLRPYLRDGTIARGTLAFLIVLMGCGFGALNEVIEFVAVVAVPETNVGGYENTAIDLVCNLIGAILAVCVLNARGRPVSPPQ